MRPVLIKNMMHVDEQCAQVLDLGLRIGRTVGECADKFEEVEEQRLGEFLELKRAVVVLVVFGGGEG